MPAYLIADIAVHDPDRYREYVEHVPALIEKHGGVYRVRGGEAEVLEGTWSPSRLIVLEFPNREAALAFCNDPEYEPYRNLRRSISDSNLVVVDGHGS
jgi:uncharacterized protein (DUF1330 family)